MQILIVTDIFGKMEWVTRLGEAIERLDMSVELLSPYDEEIRVKKSNSQMYSIFREKCGHEGILEKGVEKFI